MTNAKTPSLQNFLRLLMVAILDDGVVGSMEDSCDLKRGADEEDEVGSMAYRRNRARGRET